MMLLEMELWPLLALIGGGIYLYFPGVFMITRDVLKKDGRKVGNPASVATAYILCTLWLLSAVYMIVMAWAELSKVA